ncbi:MAG TPA: protein kinase [Anaerolineaceae bacterium]|nr:protein kinase [Anaerolineaceae bacterium]HPN50278.1 protein kinase [Anaerolineaceae bacterium]
MTSKVLEWQVGDLILDTYEVKQVFTSGGMGLVYRVYHRGWNMELAVKSPRAEIIQFEESKEAFIREAETWVNLGLYPYIVCCYYIRAIDSMPRIFMEYVDGGSLKEAIENSAIYAGTGQEALQRMLDVAVQFAWGLDYAHERGLVHQDIKPANVMMTHEGIVKVTDFGLAQAKAAAGLKMESAGLKPAALSGDASLMVNARGMTPTYCSPEQAALKPLSRRTDVWSWAASVLEMFCGRRTWAKGEEAGEALEKYLINGPVNAKAPLMPRSLAEILRQCFQPDPDDRPRDMTVIAEALLPIYQQETGEVYPRFRPQMNEMLADTLNNRAISMADLGRYEEAINYFDDAIRADATHITSLYNRSLYLWRRGKITDTEALREYMLPLREQGERWETDYFRTLLHLERGDTQEALSILKKDVQRYGTSESLLGVAQMVQKYASARSECIKTIPAGSSINAVAISPQGDRLLSADNDHKLCLWDVTTGNCLQTMEGHTGLVRSLHFLLNGRLALSASWDNTLRLWDLNSGHCVRVMEGHQNFIQDMAISRDGKRALSASADWTLRLWDLQTGECLRVFNGHVDTIRSAAISLDDRTAVSAGYDHTIRLWDLETGECLKSILWNRSCTSNLSLTRDGLKAILAGFDNQLWMIDLVSGQPVRSYRGHTDGVTMIRVAPNGTWLVSGGIDSTLRIWDMNSGRCLRTLTGHQFTVNSLAICPTKSLAVSGSNDQTLRLWRLGAGAHAPYMTAIPQSAAEMMRLGAKVEGYIQAAKSKQEAGDFSGAMSDVVAARQVTGYQQNPRLITLGEQIASKGQRADLRGMWMVQSFETHKSAVKMVILPLRWNIAVTGSDDSHLTAWNLETGAPVRQYEGHADGVKAAALTANFTRMLTGSRDGTMRLWRVDTGECLKVFQGHTSEVNAVSLSADGMLGLSASNDQTLRLWHIQKGSTLRTLKGHTHFVSAAAMTPDTQVVVSAGWDKTVRRWDLRSGECTAVLTGTKEVIDALALSSDGLMAASGGHDQLIRIWSLVKNNCFQELPCEHYITALTFSPDGRCVASGEADGTLRLWDITSGMCLKKVKAHSGPVSGVAFGEYSNLVTVSSNRWLKVWHLDWEMTFNKQKPDARAQAFFEQFIYSHRPYDASGITRSGKASWTQADFDFFIKQLKWSGLGMLPVDEVQSALEKMAKK